ncbi:serine hydrolase [Altererythrobacter sp. ZODW24]|uniref:serine hydrolase n=1 Tax=Altererythrobacter sp. ZODW24 TaxID=2185142 RepID=UPI0013B435BB|nr:serine hydrolase [Altererythrobacter sp. ZODW24]
MTTITCRLLAPVICLAGLSVPAVGQTVPDARPANYAVVADEIAQSYHDAKLFDGVVIVATTSEILYQGAFGMANIPFDVPYSLDTKVRLASVSKPFTSALILRLEEEGLLSTSQTVAEILPEFAGKPSAQVTVDQLLSHRSGIPNYQYKPPYQALQARVLAAGMAVLQVSLVDMTNTFIDEPLEFKSGENYSYSNANYILLQMIVEAELGKSFDLALQHYIFDPVEMKNSGTLSYRSVVPGLADGYVRMSGGFQSASQSQFVGVAAPGGIYSTAGDMVQWFQTLFSDRFFKNTETLEKMTVPRAVAYNGASFIGYGLFTSSIDVNGNDVRTIGHDGWGPPYTANLQYFPETGLIVFAADSIGGIGSATYGETVRLGEDLVRASYGVSPPRPQTPADLILADLQQSHGLEGAIKEFEEQIVSGKITKLNESEINTLGYTYLAQGDMKEAVAVFALNTRLFPESANAFDSLGETRAAIEDWEEAISAYRAALELNPDNARIQEVLRALEERAREESAPQ